jgi:hypothetical protein
MLLMLNAIMLSIIMLSIIMLSVVMLSVISHKVGHFKKLHGVLLTNTSNCRTVTSSCLQSYQTLFFLPLTIEQNTCLFSSIISGKKEFYRIEPRWRKQQQLLKMTNFMDANSLPMECKIPSTLFWPNKGFDKPTVCHPSLPRSQTLICDLVPCLFSQTLIKI